MPRVPRLLCLLAPLLCLGVPARAADKPPTGNWKLSFFQANAEITIALVKFEDKDGKLTGELLAKHGQLTNVKVKEVRRDGDTLHLVLATPQIELTFDGIISPKDDKRIRGMLTPGSRNVPAEMTATEQTSLGLKDFVRQLDVPGLQEAQRLTFRPLILRGQAQQAPDEEKKQELLKQAEEADKKAQEELPKIYQEILDKHADSPVVFFVVQQLVRLQAKAKADPEKFKALVTTADEAAAAFGPAWQAEVAGQLASDMVSMGIAPGVALGQAEIAARQMKQDAPAAKRVQVLLVLQYAQQLAGKDREAKETAEKVAKLNAGLDKEYLDKTPPFKPEPYEGRKAKGDRAVVMELFTGAQCQPCVAADIAFDALERTYKPTDVILLEYHEHIPGPDALANADSVARMEYYVKDFPTKMGGVPTTVFDGKPQAGGGGPVQASKDKYDQYRKILDDQLEQASGARLTAKATRKGDTIDVQVQVADLAEAGEETKLRLALVEEVVHYVGSNGVRFHHHVVRDMPGGPEGLALKEKNGKQTVHIDLNEVRRKLTRYLQDYSINQQPFSTVQRPLELKDLHVVAFVQDDKTHKVLQGVQVDVKGGEKEGQ